jgi:uncharacterized protein YndB with AHSA1/START domain
MSSTERRADRYGTLVTIDGKPALRFERRYRHPIERIWHAISDPAEMAHWFPSNVEGERAVGAPLSFVDDAQRAAARETGEPTRSDGPMFRGTVVTYDPPTVFAFTWGGELLRFELTPEGDETVLLFTHYLTDRAVAARNGAGWDQCLRALDALLGDDDAAEGEGAESDDGWKAVYDDYLDRMGPPLGVPAGNGSLRWERSIHVGPDQVLETATDPEQAAAWGAAGRATTDPLHWDVAATEHGTSYVLTHDGIGGDAELAATWHALLVQLDMYLASGQLVPVDPQRWVPDYEALLDDPGRG